MASPGNIHTHFGGLDNLRHSCPGPAQAGNGLPGLVRGAFSKAAQVTGGGLGAARDRPRLSNSGFCSRLPGARIVGGFGAHHFNHLAGRGDARCHGKEDR